ncbi:hypothetical protein ACQKMD_11105 [Viridibacillus sp. NPDC096237]|uniref:hypothetical protein n=1 Tax=Viridibacillus sp. NPDC096237 TaxID=3390721 RepID=UPI003CFF9C7B
MKIDWNVVGSISSAVATLAALVSIIITTRYSRKAQDLSQYDAQPWFHMHSVNHGDSKAIILNDASPQIRIEKIVMFLNGSEKEKIDYKYTKKNDTFIPTGKSFVINLPSLSDYVGKDVCFKIYFHNYYNESMIATSPDFTILEGNITGTMLDTKNKLYKPFKNELNN